MVLDTNDLTEALAQLDQEGGDNLHLEAKTFSEYSSSSIAPTLSAFANLPGGGTILLGVTEKPLDVVGVSHPHELAKRVSNLARNGFSSPIGVDVRTIRLGSLTVLAVNVRESSDGDKPCRWRETKYAYLRQYDGDYRMSSQEEQQLLLRHTRPREDSHGVAATGKEDLDAGLVATFVGNVRRGSTALANATEEDILLNLNVVTEDGTLTRAGLYALGTYPQRFLPALSITAAYLPDPEAVDGVRATDRLDITGPVPAMLDAAVSWVDRVADRTIRFRHGHGYDQAEYPSLVVRELVANALVHRDISEPALTKRVEIRLLRDKLVIGSPGGLYGLSVDQLGTRDGKSAVNEYLYQICTFVSAPDGHRVIEGLGSGIRAAQQALAAADMEPVRFQDTGVRFTAIVPRAALLLPQDLEWLGELGAQDLTVPQRHALVDMRHGTTWTNAGYRRRFGVDTVRARQDLHTLVSRGYAVQTGTRGSTAYSLAAQSPGPDQPTGPAVGSPAQEGVPAGTTPEALRRLSRNAPAIWEVLADGPASTSQVVAATGLSARQVSYALKALRDAGLVVVNGRPGSRTTSFARHDAAADASPDQPRDLDRAALA